MAGLRGDIGSAKPQTLQQKRSIASFTKQLFSSNKHNGAGLSLIIERESKLTEQQGQYPEALRGVINPCTYLRPLEYKMEPRPEVMTFFPNQFSEAAPVSAIAIARQRGETSRKLAGEFVDDDIHAMLEESSYGRYLRRSPSHASFDIADSHQIEYVASASSYGAEEVVQWIQYLSWYSNGNFCILNPPEPPRQNPYFEYLPAVHPPNELERLYSYNKYNGFWPDWNPATTKFHLEMLMKKFDTPYVSLSFFTESDELLRMEKGFGIDTIDRSISISAHVLYSDSVLAVVDTKKDWRFRNNPLVVGGPRIRFFAGAPLIANDGYAIGVLSVFDEQPRPGFTAQQRHGLAEASHLIMEDLRIQAKKLTDPDLRSTPLLQRDSVINADYKPRNVESPVMGYREDDMNHKQSRSGLRCRRVIDAPKRRSRMYLTSRSQTLLTQRPEPTPPSSADADNRFFFGKDAGFDKSSRKLIGPSQINDAIPTHQESEYFRNPTSRPFSSSDITSLFHHPPNSPVDTPEAGLSSKLDVNLITDRFLTIDDVDVSEDILAYEPENVVSQPSSPFHQSTYKGKQPSSTPSSITSIASENREVQEQAAYACCDIAQKLDYDVIYVVEMKPKRLGMTDNELFVPSRNGGLHKNIIAAYKMTTVFDLDPKLHINALRSRGATQWYSHVPARYLDESEVQMGHLVPMWSLPGVARKYRNTGFVLGAFRRPRITPNAHTDEEEAKKLAEFAEDIRLQALLDLYIPALQEQGNRGPARRTSFPANEATHVRFGDSTLETVSRHRRQ